MHVEATTRLIPREILARIANPRLVEASEARSERSERRPDESASEALRCELQRDPPKVFLSGVPAFPPAAELRIAPLPQGSHVILRLMWGPLPAPFPRALAAVGVLVALALIALFSTSPLWLAAAAVLVVLPAVALWRQRIGERRLQDHLSALLGDCRFSPRPH
jgi:hypothetical protein